MSIHSLRVPKFALPHRRISTQCTDLTFQQISWQSGTLKKLKFKSPGMQILTDVSAVSAVPSQANAVFVRLEIFRITTVRSYTEVHARRDPSNGSVWLVRNKKSYPEGHNPLPKVITVEKYKWESVPLTKCSLGGWLALPSNALQATGKTQTNYRNKGTKLE